jgi:hypothetical protein
MLRRVVAHGLRARPGLASLRAGKPGWDRPDVPLNEVYQERRRITLDTRIRGLYISGFLPEHAISNTSVWFQDYEDGKPYKLFYVKMFMVYLGMCALVSISTYMFGQTVYDYKLQRLIEGYMKEKL